MAKPGGEPPDEVLVVAAILGDLDAFDELASRYRAAVVRTAQAIVGREDAEDVAQDALLLAFKALPSIEEPPKFAGWLSTITRHRALRFSKRERQREVQRRHGLDRAKGGTRLHCRRHPERESLANASVSHRMAGEPAARISLRRHSRALGVREFFPSVSIRRSHRLRKLSC